MAERGLVQGLTVEWTGLSVAYTPRYALSVGFFAALLAADVLLVPFDTS